MYEHIRRYLDLPALYQATETAFWDDDYISKQMLKAHLDPKFDGASRNLDFIERSVSWIQTAVPPQVYPTLLDVGCGPGLYAERFTKCGYQVTGVDFSRRSIHYAQKSAQKKHLTIQYICQNYCALKLDASYDFAVIIYCDYGALSAQNRRIVLHHIHQHLKPGGKLLFDVFSMAAYNAFSEAQTWEIQPDGGFWRETGYAAFHRNRRYSERVTLEQTTVVTDEDLAAYYLWNTYFTDRSLIEEVRASGFELCEIYGDVGGCPYHAESPTIAVLLEKS